MTSAIASPPSIDWNVADLEALVERLDASSADPGDVKGVRTLVDSYLYLLNLIESKKTTIRNLRQVLFGSKSEKKDKVLGGEKGEKGEEAGKGGSAQPSPTGAKPRPKAKGHGRNGANAYPGATRTIIEHPSLRPGDACPNACTGRVYLLKEPARIVRLFGRPPVGGDILERERLRCHVCGEVFTAAPPEGTKEEKYDPTAVSIVAVLRYGSGLPFNRIADLQQSFGIPLPVSTQWDLVHGATSVLTPVYDELRRLAAQGDLIHNDDTPMTILAIEKELRERRARGEDPPERTGVFTTGMVAIGGGHHIVLYATGLRHAGENILDILMRRAKELPPPQQMCDGLDRNLPAEFETIVSNCLVHYPEFSVIWSGDGLPASKGKHWACERTSRIDGPDNVASSEVSEEAQIVL